MRPKISVVIPVYNRAHSVLPTLQSVQAQTFRDFECIVVDDGSKDGDELRRVVEQLKDARFRYVRRENGGGGAARNTGIDEAKGDNIAFLDSDDRWLPEKLQRDLEAGSECEVIFSAVQVERAGRIVGRKPGNRIRLDEAVPEYLACRGGFTQTSTMMLPTSLAQSVRFDERLPFGQDTDFAVRLYAAGAEFRMLDQSSVVMNDDETGDRISRSNDWRTLLAWLDRAKPILGNRAYLAYRGSQVARMAAEDGYYRQAFYFYSIALVARALSPRIALKSLAQLLVGRSFYRKLQA